MLGIRPVKIPVVAVETKSSAPPAYEAFVPQKTAALLDSVGAIITKPTPEVPT